MGCLRRLQHWNFSSIIVEYRAYAGNKARYVNEQFIELFDIDWITLPASLPTWWIEQEAMWVCINYLYQALARCAYERHSFPLFL